MRNVRPKQSYFRTATHLNKISLSLQGSKRRKLESGIPMPLLLAVESCDQERSGRHEAEAREPIPSSSLDTNSESTPSSPKPFFTEDGYDECLETALHCSNREASLEKWRRLNVMEKDIARSLEANDESLSPQSLSPFVKTRSHSPPPDEFASPEASQKSYGGGWVEEIADELLEGGSSAVMSSPQNIRLTDQVTSAKGDSAIDRKSVV